ncbi:MAG: N-acetylmuramoyl-L-alanine amidase [Clostridia bacterium]|nr:N-acetylmuramoyl-L-alanine amidase [Clostridia bacterium]
MNSRICVSVGHGKSKNGNFDPGACSEGLREFDLAKNVAKYLSQYLRSAGFTVELINYDGSLYLTERVRKINAGCFDFALEIHLNAGGGTGSEVYYPKGSQEGRRAAGLISAEIADMFSIPDRGAKTKEGLNGGDYFAVVRETKPLTLLVETVFIDSPDVENLTSASGRDLCARAISKAVIRFFNEKATPFTVKILCDELNVRNGPGTNHKVNMTVSGGKVFTIVEQRGNWGRLRSGAGWINLSKNLVELWER